MNLLERRKIMMQGGGGLPYDAEVEYLQNSGLGEYFDTGIYGSDDLVVEIEACVMDSGNYGIFACDNGSTYNEAYTLEYFNGIRPVMESVYAQFVRTIQTGVFYKIKMGNGVFEIDGISYRFDNVTDSYTTAYTIKPFVWVRNGNPISSVYNKIIKIKSMKMIKNGVVVRDYIAVRKDGIGYMYDKVSGTLYGNSGTGNFILGPDVN